MNYHYLQLGHFVSLDYAEDLETRHSFQTIPQDEEHFSLALLLQWPTLSPKTRQLLFPNYLWFLVFLAVSH